MTFADTQSSFWLKAIFAALVIRVHRAIKRADYLRWKRRHPDGERLNGRRWRAENRARYRQSKTAWRKSNPEKQRACERAWKASRPDLVRASARRCNARKRLSGKSRQYENQRYREDPQFNLKKKIRSRIWTAFDRAVRGERKPETTIRLLGCSYAQLREHIVAQFESGMSWEAVVDGRIHLDHIRPVVSFDLTDALQVAECFSYKNLQPLWAVDNLIKHAKI